MGCTMPMYQEKAPGSVSTSSQRMFGPESLRVWFGFVFLIKLFPLMRFCICIMSFVTLYLIYIFLNLIFFASKMVQLSLPTSQHYCEYQINQYMQNSQHKHSNLLKALQLLLIQRVLKHKTDESPMVIWLSPLSFRVLIF